MFLLVSSMFVASFSQGSAVYETGSVTADGRRVSLTLEMDPVFLTEGQMNGSAVIRLREVNTDTTISHVTYNVKIMRASVMLLEDRFHSHDGVIKIQFEHVDAEDVEVIGNRESLYNAIVADQRNPAIVKGLVLYGGLYHYTISVMAMNQYENRLSDPLNFEIYASVGQISHYDVLDSDGRQHTLSIKTYYDLLDSLDYDVSSRNLTFTMPLKWNVNYLSQVPFVHEEVQVPRDFVELMANSYIGTVNGVELSNREVMIDDYSSESMRIVHFVVHKDRLIDIAQKQRPEQDIAVFTLMPRDIPKFPLEILSGKENFLLQISWSPAVIEPDKSTKFIVTVRDPVTLDTLNHASADIVLLRDGKEIFRKHHTAPIGAIVQDYTFTGDQTGNILLLVENINNTGESAPLQFTVVPEFPMGSFVAMLAIISAVILLTRVRKLQPKSSFS
jgi:hypothetical protein